MTVVEYGDFECPSCKQATVVESPLRSAPIAHLYEVGGILRSHDDDGVGATFVRYLEDFAEGQTFRSGRLVVSAEQIRAFAVEFDPQPFHLDEQAAQDTVFRDRD